MGLLLLFDGQSSNLPIPRPENGGNRCEHICKRTRERHASRSSQYQVLYSIRLTSNHRRDSEVEKHEVFVAFALEKRHLGGRSIVIDGFNIDVRVYRESI